MNPSLHFHLSGRWWPGEVRVRLVPAGRRETPESRDAIERAWREVSLAAPEVELFDGPMCRLEAFHAERGGALWLEVSRTSYRVFLGTNLHGPRDLPRQSLANPLGVSPALETADGFLLFGRRSGRVAYYPHRLHPFSGALEPPRREPDPLDVFDECRRELAEELSLSSSEVTEVVLLGIVEDAQIRHPELILHARTTLGRDEVAARLDPAEHEAIHAVPAARADVEAALGDERFTPVGHAALRLWLDGAVGAHRA